ncbi:MAG TPA: ABC transporter substrate-binding protein [Thermoleophilia bacterium]|nr:ABC transporter substrate-binding protein [Thermoleophilia bacterium]
MHKPSAVTAAFLLGLALLLALGLVACGAGTTEEASSPSSFDTPKQGGTLTLSYLTEPSSLDPAVAWNVIDRQIEHDIYQSFLQYAHEPGAAGTELVPCLATEVPSTANGGISADGKVYTFKLREGVRFQPPVSREVTASDFKYSFERMMKEPRAPATSFYMGVVGSGAFVRYKAQEITGFKVVDDFTVEITLKRPDVSFLNAVTMDFCDVVPKEWVEKWGDEFGRNPLGTGPYVLQRWTPGQEILLTRNPDYWEEGKPYLDTIDYQLSFDPSTALLKLERGEVDILGDGVPVADIPRVQADPEWKAQVFSQPLVATSYMFMNVEMKPFDDVKVRRALSWAIDRDKLVTLQAGQAMSLWQFYPKGMPGHDEGKVFYGFDPAKAKQLLADAGYPDGFETMLYTDNVDPNPRLWQSVQADLAAVGVKAQLKTMSNTSFYVQQATPMTLAAGSLGWWMDFPDPSDWIAPLFSKASAAEGGMNSSFWWSPKVEKMFTEAQKLTDPVARIAKYSEMQDFISKRAPYVPCYQPIQTTMCSETTGGFYLHPVYQIDPTQYWKE